MKLARFILTAGVVILFFVRVQMATAATNVSTNASTASIAQVPVLDQKPELPTGCEATALTMLLQWEKVKVDKVAVAHAFPQLPIPTYENSQFVGGNPNVGYVGDPATNTGYGVYHSPVAAVLNQYLPNRAFDLTGQSFAQLLATIASGRPVLAWISDDLQEPAQKIVWDDPSGQEVNWIGPEHVVVMTGFTPTTITVNDPETGKVLTYPRQMFELRWEQMGKQAVTVTPLTTADTATAKPAATEQSTPMSRLLASFRKGSAACLLFLKKNKNSMWETYAIIFIVIFISYYVSLSFVNLLKKRKQRNRAKEIES